MILLFLAEEKILNTQYVNSFSEICVSDICRLFTG